MEIKGARILVVDDEEPIIQIMVDFFTMFGAKILTAKNGIEAIRIIFNENIDLIISDKDMSKMSGMELLLEIRQRSNQYIKNIPIIIMSGYDIETEAKRAGADGFMQKPISLMELKELIERL